MRFVPIKSAEQQAAAMVLKDANSASAPKNTSDQRLARSYVRIGHHRGCRPGEGGGISRDRA